jgi:pimeloyl-ACP methyl ester carboxylesterase
MKKVLKTISLFLLLSIGVLIFTGVYFDIPREKLETKYATEASQFLNLPDGTRIHYRDEGRADKPAIVLLHGFNGSLLNFERLVPLLANDFRLVSLDLPGFGLTGATPSADYTSNSYMDIVTSITNYLGVNKFSIAGNSMGGGVAWRYAIEYPSKIEGLILLASSGVMKKEDRDRFEQRKDNSPIVWKLMGSSVIKKTLTYYTPRFFATQGLKASVFNQELATKEYARQFHDLTLLEGSRKAILSMGFGSRDRKYGPEIFKKIIAPTLVIHGKEDNIIGVESSESFKKNIKHVEVKVYLDTGHLPMYEDPERTANDIIQFLNIELNNSRSSE